MFRDQCFDRSKMTHGFDCAQTVAPNIARAAGRSDPNAVVLGSLACLLDAPEWIGTPRRRVSRMPADDVVMEIDVASFTDQVRQMCSKAGRIKLMLWCWAFCRPLQRQTGVQACTCRRTSAGRASGAWRATGEDAGGAGPAAAHPGLRRHHRHAAAPDGQRARCIVDDMPPNVPLLAMNRGGNLGRQGCKAAS